MTGLRIRIGILVWVSLCLVNSIVTAQAQTCPEIVQTALFMTNELCGSTERNQVCYGNVKLDATPRSDVADFNFSAPGDRVSASAIEGLRLSSKVERSGVWGVALMSLQATLPETLPGQNVVFLLFGDVEISNRVASNGDPVSIEVTSRGDIDVHSEPSMNSERIGGLTNGEVVTARGRTADKFWLQIELPAETIGWILASHVHHVRGLESLLNIVDPSQPQVQPLAPIQAFYFRSGIGDAPCAEAPDSGILVQTPEGMGQIQFTVNEVNIMLGSTAYLQAQPGGEMVISMIEGQATLSHHGWTVVAPAGSRVRVPLNDQGTAEGPPNHAETYDAARLAALPIGILPRAITIADPISGGGIAGGVIPEAGQWQVTWNPPSITCDVVQSESQSGSVTQDQTSFNSFRLPDSDSGFNPLVLYGAIFQYDATGSGMYFSSPVPDTYVTTWDTGYFDMRIIDPDHIEGHRRTTSAGGLVSGPCEFPFSFVATRVGD